MNKTKILQAGKIAKQVVEYAKSIINKDVPLIEIATKIEDKIIELGAKIAFPVNLSINEVAAHFTPYHDDKTLAHGLLKVDIGVHIDGWIADTAFSVDLEDSEQNKKLITASEEALKNALNEFNEKTLTTEIGQTISETIESYGFSPIVNLGGHGLDKYDFHAEPFIPNIDNHKDIEIEKGQYAIEPFATTGGGSVHDGNPHGIYQLQDDKNIRSPLAREVLEHIINEYNALPFAQRWIVKKFGTKGVLALKQLEANGNIHHYPQLIESSKAVVAQSEHTILINENGEKIVTTRD